MTEVFSRSSGCISIWLYPAKASMKESSSFPAIAYTMWSKCGNGKISFGHALFRSVKSTHTLQDPFFFLTTSGLASHSRYLTSIMEPAFVRSSTYAFTGSVRSGPSFLFFCLTGFRSDRRLARGRWCGDRSRSYRSFPCEGWNIFF